MAHIEANKHLFTEHLDGLLIHSSHYLEDFNFTKLAWIRNCFVEEENDEFGLATIEKVKLIELSYETSLKQKFQSEAPILF